MSSKEIPLKVGAPRRSDILPALDGIRGLAVLMVLFDHAGDAGLKAAPALDVNGIGKLGVLLFFSLSAFLLTYPFFLREPSRIVSSRVWAEYALRRFLRVFPLFVIVLAVHNWRTRSFTDTEFWQHLALRMGQQHFWTIPVEIKYYLLLPLVVVALGWFWRVKGWKMGLFAVLVMVAVVKLVFFPLEKLWSIDHEIRLERTVQVFLLGSAAGILHAWLVRHPLPQRAARLAMEAAALIALGLIILQIPSIRDLPALAALDTGLFRQDISFCAIAWAVFILGQLHGLGFLRRIFEFLPLRALGFISYSAYLWHRMILKDADEIPVPRWLGLLIYLCIVLAFATVSYLLIERPLSRIRLSPTPARKSPEGNAPSLP